MMYFLPEDFRHSDCLVPVSPHEITEMENRFEGFDNEYAETNLVFCEYFQYVMENIAYPTPQAFWKQEFFLRS